MKLEEIVKLYESMSAGALEMYPGHVPVLFILVKKNTTAEGGTDIRIVSPMPVDAVRALVFDLADTLDSGNDLAIDSVKGKVN